MAATVHSMQDHGHGAVVLTQVQPQCCRRQVGVGLIAVHVSEQMATLACAMAIGAAVVPGNA